jgi:tetratricopeptide (TPR) repeat protein
MKLPAVGFGHSMIRVDSPSDVIFLSGDEAVARSVVWPNPVPRPPHAEATTSELKALGTAYFKKGLLIPAARIWSLGIRRDPKYTELRLNRAQAYISLEWYNAALDDALHALESSSTSNLATKAAYRAARAEYGLSCYPAALGRFQVIEDDSAREWETRCRRRIQETQDGEYRWTDMFQEGQALVPRLDVASYTGPIKVELVEGRGGGHGVVASQGYTNPELLVC